jgi:hypothetical protein
MKTFAFVSAALVALSLALAGCGAVRGGRNVVKFDEGKAPIMVNAPASGTYALYSLTDYTPKVSIFLKEGDKIGFKGSSTGEVIAVAGDREIPLSANASYYWKKQD